MVVIFYACGIHADRRAAAIDDRRLIQRANESFRSVALIVKSRPRDVDPDARRIFARTPRPAACGSQFHDAVIHV